MVFDVSVVICAYSAARWEALLAAVDSVRCQTVQPREIILVIDHNPALAAQARLTLPDVVVAENREAPGLSGARNTSISLARGSVLAFLDDDACAATGWLEQLLSGYADSRVIGVGGAIEPQWLAGRPAWFPDEFGWVVGCGYRGLPEAPAPVRNLIGASMSLRADVFAAVGGFRNGMGRVRNLPAGCEETELCIRAGQRWPNAWLLYDPRAKVMHQVTAERSTWAYFCARCYAEGRSKALVARLVGASDGLASERAYVRHTLPRGIVNGLQDAFGRHDWMGLRRAYAIMAGVLMTASGYLVGRLDQLRPNAPLPAAQSGVGAALSR